ncbi:MAG: hypothetical protein AB8B51_11025 [Sedimentitalea sp.]
MSSSAFLSMPRILGFGLFAALAAFAAWYWLSPRLPSPEQVEMTYATPLPAPQHPLQVFHLGHSLVGRDMPAMLAQLAGQGHDYASQLGWGASLKQHWEPNIPVNGFEVENAHDRHRPVKPSIADATLDAFVMTEMVELRDAIAYHDSAKYVTSWADHVHAQSPKTRVYLYETWHRLDDEAGWLARLDADLPALWERELLLPHLARSQAEVYVIPAGQVMAQFVRALEADGPIGEMTDRTSLFARTPKGEVDPIHLGDLGAYLVALTHYAVLYHRSPVGLAFQLKRADGTPAQAPNAKAALLMQQTVWDVVTSYPKTGVAQ